MKRNHSLNGQVVVITGGAGLLGQVFLTAVAEAGGVAVCADIDAARARKTADGATAATGGTCDAISLDITSPPSVAAMLAELHGRWGRIHALVNNAYPRNANYGRVFEDVQIEDFNANVSMHLGGYFLTAQRAALYFREHGGGAIVNMASIYGVMAPRFEVYAGTAMTMPVEYAVIKSGIIHLTRYMASYFKGDGIRVNCLSPGGILDSQPQAFLDCYNAHCAGKGMLAPQDMAGALLFLLGDEGRYVNGQNLVVDDGFSL